MKIEIGKKYKLEPTFKKSVVDVEHYLIDGNEIDMTTIWRWGSWYVTPQNQDEVIVLGNAMQSNVDLCITDFEDYEMIETTDGCSLDIDFVSGEWTFDQFELFRDQYYEDSIEATDKFDVEIIDCDTYIDCAISLTEVE